jgi:hypothetical protein
VDVIAPAGHGQSRLSGGTAVGEQGDVEVGSSQQLLEFMNRWLRSISFRSPSRESRLNSACAIPRGPMARRKRSPASATSGRHRVTT